MQVGTKVYWFEVDRVKHYMYKYHKGEKPESVKFTGTVMTLPSHESNWVCLVARDDTGRIVDMSARRLYIIPPELPL